MSNLEDIVYTKYGEKSLDVYLHPWGFGGWHYDCEMPFSAHVKIRLMSMGGLPVTSFIPFLNLIS